MALATNLVSYWKLDESSGNAVDSVGSNTLTNTGTATYSAGKINNGVNFGATTQYLGAANPTGLPTGAGAFTISLWVNFANFSSARYFAGWGTVGNNTNISVRCDNATTWVVDDNGSGTAFPAVSSMSTGTWYHYVMTYPGSGNVYTAYLNGTSIGTANNTRPPNLGSGVVGLGSRDNTSTSINLVGSLDEVGIWTRALSGTEVASLYNSGAGIAYPFGVVVMAVTVGAFAFTGVSIILNFGWLLTTIVANFTLTGIAALFKRGGWIYSTKDDSVSSFDTKHSSTSNYDHKN